MNYATGASGFIGKNLSKKIDIIPVPHKNINQQYSRDFGFFFYLSTYGNLASQTQDFEVFKANVFDPLNVLEKIINSNFKSFMYVSTSSVKLKKQTMYSRSKKAGEEIMLSVLERYSKPICIVRPLSVTGVGEQKEHLIPTLIDAAFTGKTINFVSWPTHDYIDVDDVTDGMINLAKNSARGVYELGTGTSYSNIEVKDIVESVTGKIIKVNPITSLRDYDTGSWISTNFKSRGFGWLPKKSLRQSIEEMVKDYVN